MKKTKIIHKYILIRGKIRYLCNQACNTDWRKTDITNKKINCKNCKKIIKKSRENHSKGYFSCKTYIEYLAKRKIEEKKLMEIIKNT